MSKPPPPVAIGAKMLGYTIIKFKGTCEKCGGPMAVAQKLSPRTGKPMTTHGCPVCRRAHKNTAYKYEKRHPDIPYDIHANTEGFAYIKRLWSEKADKKIKEYWAERGMTEEEAREKWTRRRHGVSW